MDMCIECALCILDDVVLCAMCVCVRVRESVFTDFFSLSILCACSFSCHFSLSLLLLKFTLSKRLRALCSPNKHHSGLVNVCLLTCSSFEIVALQSSQL